jgi:dihydropteroate synthase
MSVANLGGIKVGDGEPVAMMGVLNLSRNSFYRGSVVGRKEVIKVGKKMVEEGADILDVGAMSTRPGAEPISAEQERRRLIPAVKTLVRKLDSPISVDTQRAAIAELALREGAAIVNDVSGFKADPDMPGVVANFEASAILMASWVRPGKLLIARQKAGGNIETIEGIVRSLRCSLDICDSHGIDRKKLVIDPGIGFSKGPLASSGKQVTRQHPKSRWHERDIRVLANLDGLKSLDRPICVGISRKSFIGKILGLADPADRLVGSLAATAIAVFKGAAVIRTHDPAETIHAIRVAERIRESRC